MAAALMTKLPPVRFMRKLLLGLFGEGDIRCQPHRGPGSQGAKEQREDQLRRFAVRECTWLGGARSAARPADSETNLGKDRPR